MNTEIETRLDAIEQKLEDTYNIVRKMRGAQKRAAALKVAYWAVIIILGFVAVEAIKPYLDQLTEVYGTVTTTTQGYGDLLKSLRQ
jgi:hypothetical protein